MVHSGWAKSRLLLAALGVMATLRALHAAEFALPAQVEHFALDYPAGDAAPPVVVGLAVADAAGLFATAGDDGLVRIWDADRGAIARVLPGRDDWVRSVDFHPGGRLLASGGDDGELRLWSVDGKRLGAWPVASSVYCVRFSPDGRTAAAVGFNGVCLLVDVATLQPRRRMKCPCQDVRTIAYSPDSQTLAAAGRNGRVRLWHPATGEVTGQFDAGPRRIRCLDFIANDRLLTTGDAGDVKLWDAATGKLLRSWATGQGRVYSTEIIEKEVLATGGSDNTVRFWSLADGSPLGGLVDARGTVAGLAYRESTGELLGGGFDATVRLWRLRDEANLDRQARTRQIVQ